MKFTYQGTEYKLILLTLAGSRFYGTHYDANDPERIHPFKPDYTSDQDLRGVFIAHPDTKIGMTGSITEIEVKKNQDGTVPAEQQALIQELNQKLGLNMAMDEDLTLYEVKKFITLALENNPNLMDIIYTDKDAVIYENKKGKQLRKQGKDIFMSTKTKFTFSGYAMSQLNRIRGTIQYSPKTLKILYKALKNKDIDNDWIRENFKGLHEKKLIAEYNKLIKYDQ